MADSDQFPWYELDYLDTNGLRGPVIMSLGFNGFVMCVALYHEGDESQVQFPPLFEDTKAMRTKVLAYNIGLEPFFEEWKREYAKIDDNLPREQFTDGQLVAAIFEITNGPRQKAVQIGDLVNLFADKYEG